MPRKPIKLKTVPNAPNFAALVDAVRQVHEHSAAAASRAVNASLTLRNWAIGCYIVEYEQNGADRAKYGARLLESLSDALTTRGVEDMAARSLRLYRQFFLTYENIWQALPAKSASALLPASIWQTLSAKLRPQRPGRIREGASPRSGVAVEKLFTRLSFSHFDELIAIDSRLFVSKYQLELPSKEDLQRFLEEKRREMNDRE